LSSCPRSSLPAEVLAWLASRLAHLTPSRRPGLGGTPPLSLEVRLDAVGAVLLDGLSYRRAGRVVGISKTEVGDSLDLLLDELGALGFCQPDGTFITTLGDLRQWLAEMAQTGEAVWVDGLATRVQRPRGWANQKVVDDAKRHTHTAQGLSVSTIWGDLCGATGAGRATATSTSSSSCRAWRGAGRQRRRGPVGPGGSGLGQVPRALARAGRGPAHQGSADRRAAGVQPLPGWAACAGGAVDRPSRQRLGAAPLARAAVPARDVFRAAGALVCLGRWLHRVPT